MLSSAETTHQISLTALKAVFNNIPFSLCPNISTHEFKIKDENCLDRYNDICVHSEIIPSTAVTINTNGYINANFIDGVTHQQKYIACQAPLENTTTDFWQMVWEQNSRVIVMLTPLVEAGRSKSAQYWPWPDVSKNYGNFTVQRLQYIPVLMNSPAIMPSSLQITKFALMHSGSSEKREIWHIHLTNWPDHNAVGPDALLQVLKLYREKAIETETSATQPIIVHCSAGIGRTGVFIASDICWDMLQKKFEPNVADIVKQLRMQRYAMVQTVAQFQLIHELIPILKKIPPPTLGK